MKRDNTDCRNQLYQQVAAFMEDINEDTVFPLDYNWPKLMELVKRVDGFQTLIQQRDSMLRDFTDLIQGYKPNWIPIQALASTGNKVSNVFKIKQRIVAALKNIQSEMVEPLNYADREGLEVKYGWAKEVVIDFIETPTNTINLEFGVWPGSTKYQAGKFINKLGNNPSWQPPDSLTINGKDFEVKWTYDIRFSHFNRYRTHLELKDSDLKPGKKLISKEVHHKHTGMYKRDRWNELNDFLEKYIVDDFNWKEKARWKEVFEDSGRNYLTLAIGYKIQTIVLVEYLQTIDTKIENLEPLSNFIMAIEKEYANLFDNN